MGFPKAESTLILSDRFKANNTLALLLGHRSNNAIGGNNQ